MAKTPVSVLQEMSAVQKIQPPVYDLIFNRSDGVNPEFKYRVTFGSIAAVGTGRSKKEAKHNAAETALRKLTERNAGSVQEPIISPYSQQVQRNYVGELMTYCSEKQPLEAKFEEHRAAGPSHAPCFTMKCTVSKFEELAEASTKKQAKQLVAKKMLQRLQACLKDGMPQQSKPPSSDNSKSTECDEMKRVFQKVRDHPLLPATVIPNSINELHTVLKQNYSMPEPLLTLHVERDTTHWDPIKKAKDVADTMNVTFRMDLYKGIPKGTGAWFAVATLDSNPPVTVIAYASSEREAKNKTAEDLLSHLVDMLKD